MAERHEKGFLIITINLGTDWTQVFGNANLTVALLDRLMTHEVHIIEGK